MKTVKGFCLSTLAVLSLSALYCASTAVAQVQTGTPNFSAYDNFGVDSINLQNLNVIINLPVRRKAGAIPFNYGMANDSYMYVNSGQWWPGWPYGVPSMTPGIPNQLMSAPTYGATSLELCPDGVHQTRLYENWYFVTIDGTYHYIPTGDYTDLRTDSSGLSCFFTTITAQTIDSSGYTLTATQATATSLYARDGTSIPFSGATIVQDPNGNTIKASTSSHTQTWTDSLGVTPLTYTTNTGVWSWTDVNGGSPQVSLTTSSENFKSVFGCTGISDYSLTNGSVVTGLSYPDGTSLTVGFEATPNNTGYVTGRIGKITLRTGGSVTYGYSGSNHGLNCTYQVPPTMARTTSDGTDTYTWTAVNNGSGNWGNTTTKVDNGGNKTVYTFTGLTISGNAAAPVVQALTEVQHYQGSSTLLTTDLYSYNTPFTNTPSASTISKAVVSLPITRMIVYHQVGSMSNYSATATDFDAYGNVVWSGSFDFGGSTSVTFTTTTYYQSGTSCGALSSGSNINDRPCEVQTTQNLSVIADIKYSFDTYGNLTKTSVWNGSSWIGQITSNSYNSNGTPSTTYDLANNPTSYLYSSTAYSDGCGSSLNPIFPTKITAGGLSVTRTYDCQGGVVLTAADANSNATTFCYNTGSICSGGTADPYWRVMQSIEPINSVATVHTYPTGSSPTISGVSMTFNAGNSIHGTTYTVDGLGRTIDLQRPQSPSGSNYDTVSKSYGWSGNYRTISSSEPCSQTLSGACTTLPHVLDIDPIDRLYTSSTTSNETITNTYSTGTANTYTLFALTPAPSGENSKQVQTAYDGLGRVASVCHVGSTTSTGSATACPSGSYNGAVDAFTYTQGTGYTEVYVTRAGAQQRTTYYDAMGRVYKRITPEGGTWTSTYDSNSSCPSGYQGSTGQLASTLDPNGNLLCYKYDSLNRVTGVNANGTTCRHYYYDNSYGTVPSGVTTPTNSLGRLAEASTDNCSGTLITDEWFSYDQDGNNIAYYQSSPHSTQYYYTSVGFVIGPGIPEQAVLSNPSLYTITYGLDGEGRYVTLKDGSTMEVTGPTAVGGMYDSGGHVLNVQLTGTTPDQDIYTYDQYTGNMKTFEFEVGNTPANLTGTITWNANRTVAHVAVVDGFNSGGSSTCYSDSNSSVGYGYDDWGRLMSFDCGSGNVGENYSYDQYDNLNMSIPTGRTGWTLSTTYNSSNQMTGNTYDLNGNTTADGGSNTYGYNEFSKVKWTATTGTPTCGTSGKCATYDAFGRVVETSAGSVWTELWYPQVPGARVSMSGTTQRFAYWPSPGRGVYLEQSAKAFLHQDWLGNDRIVSSFGTHTAVADRDYTPYGQQFNAFGGSNPIYGFFAEMTGDYNAGTLFDTPNREFAVNQVRWLSPDPAGSGWNQYAYPTNPNSFVDPSGLCGGLSKIGSEQRNFCGGGGNPYAQDFSQVDEYGNNIFDAIEGAPGTYLTINEQGQLGFGFSEDLWSNTLNIIDSYRSGVSENGIDLPPYPLSGFQTTVVSLGTDVQFFGLIPEYSQILAQTSYLTTLALPYTLAGLPVPASLESQLDAAQEKQYALWSQITEIILPGFSQWNP